MKKFFGFFAKLGKNIFKFFREIKVELKKVVWPTWSQTRNNTIIVLICVLIVGLAIWILDAVFKLGLVELLK